MAWNDRVTFSDLVGKTLAEINGAEAGSDEVVFVADSGERFKMYHARDCCECVSVNDVEGDLADLIGSPILLAEESTSDENQEGMPRHRFQDDSFTWTFYRIATAKGFVVIRWYGESNGYYSESVDFARA